MNRILTAVLIIISAITFARAADKPIGKPEKPNCDDLATYLNTPSCWKGRRE